MVQTHVAELLWVMSTSWPLPFMCDYLPSEDTGDIVDSPCRVAVENVNRGGSKVLGAEFEKCLVQMRSKQSHFFRCSSPLGRSPCHRTCYESVIHYAEDSLCICVCLYEWHLGCSVDLNISSKRPDFTGDRPPAG